MDRQIKDSITQILRNTVSNTILRMRTEDSHRPFHSALLSDEVLKFSRFERSFSTSFGQGAIEQISKLAATVGGATDARGQVAVDVKISQARLNKLEGHIADIRNKHSGIRGSWDTDLRNILLVDNTAPLITSRVIADLWWVKDNVNNYLSIKTVKPNIDQTAIAKSDLMKLKLNDPQCNVYFGLYYNPYGENNSYDWGPPQKIFNFSTDSCILIGQKYWDILGGQGFYEELIEIFNEVGNETRLLLQDM